MNGEAAAGFLFFFDVLIGDDIDDIVFLAVFCGVVSAAADIVVCGGAVRFDDDHEGCQMDGGVVEEEAALARREDDDFGDEEELFVVVAAAVDQEGWNIDNDILTVPRWTTDFMVRRTRLSWFRSQLAPECR